MAFVSSGSPAFTSITSECGKEWAMYERILAAVDESQIAERVLAAAKELATLSNGEVYILHVWEAEPSKSRSCGRPCGPAG
jgi:K+-sensing histidine kinase KdpD